MSIRRFSIIALLLLILATQSFIQAQDVDCDTPLEIWQIQGETDIPNCLDERVTLAESVITAIGPEGFFIQSTGDGDPLTSDGVYVFTSRPPVGWELEVGQGIIVEGAVKEEYNFTRIEVTGSSGLTVVSEDNPLPEPIDLSTASIDYLPDGTHPMERYEGMRVFLENATVTAPTNQFAEFGVTVNGERSFREAGFERDLMPELLGNDLPEWDLNPELLEVYPLGLGHDVAFMTPGMIVSIEGNIGYSYQDYQIWSTELDFEATEFVTRPVRAPEAGEFMIATQNMENLFDITDDPYREDGTFEDYVPASAAVYNIRLRKASEQIRVQLGAPDIVALQEIENPRVVADLIQQIQTDDPSLTYYGCLLEGNDERGIDNAYLVRVDRVNVYDCYSMPGSFSEPFELGGRLYGRPPLVLEVDLLLEDGDVYPLTLVDVHIKSLSGIETYDTQLKRYQQAVGIAGFLQSLFDENEEANVVVLGDFNAFQFSDGITDVVGIISGDFDPDDALLAPEEDTLEPNLINQVMSLPEEERYSYIYNGSLQVLDQILTSPSVNDAVTDVQYSRGNADGLTILWYFEDNGAQGVSDHDGLVIYLEP
ncbi:MAG: hypothetical protein KC708_06450 [Anaerolineae bacterium]|nr:hypothetical protein [Anaerolineae bacterium]